MTDNNTELQKLHAKLAMAESERNAWKGNSDHHFMMACALVDALRKQIHDIETGERK